MPYTREPRARVAGAVSVLLLAAPLAGLMAVFPSVQDTAPATLHEWLQRERAIVDASAAGDRTRLDTLLAPDFRLRGSLDLDRQAWMDGALTDCPGVRLEIDVLGANQFEDLAIVQLELRRDLDPSTCMPAVFRSQITDVWIRGEGVWRVLVREAGAPQAVPGAVVRQPVAGGKPGAAWQLGGELSLVATGGNSSTRTFGMGGDFERRSASATTRGHAVFLTSEAEGTTNARSLKLSARHGFRRGERAELFGQGAYERDRFAGIGHRLGFDMGAAYASRLPPRQALRIEAGLGFTRESRLDGTDLRFAAARGALSYAWASGGGTELKQDLEIVQDLTASRNWRVMSTTSLSVALNRLLSVKASHAVEYRHAPVTGFGRADMRTAAALVVALKRDPGTTSSVVNR